MVAAGDHDLHDRRQPETHQEQDSHRGGLKVKDFDSKAIKIAKWVLISMVVPFFATRLIRFILQ
jgi:hypothetical protein